MYCRHCGGLLEWEDPETLYCTECYEYEFLDGHEEKTINVDDEGLGNDWVVHEDPWPLR